MLSTSLQQGQRFLILTILNSFSKGILIVTALKFSEWFKCKEDFQKKHTIVISLFPYHIASVRNIHLCSFIFYKFMSVLVLCAKLCYNDLDVLQNKEQERDL